MAGSLVSYERDGDIALIGFNRPEKRNAVSDAVIEDLAVAAQRANAEAKAAVLFGRGDHFCAGLDLAEHIEKPLMDSVFGSRRWHEVGDMMHRGKIPFVSALHGAVVGGGMELAAATHVRVAEKNAFFALPEGQRGIFVGGSGSVRIARLIGVARMTDLMLTGRVFSAAEAERYNLAQYLVEDGEALEKAKELARAASTNAPMSTYAILNALPRIQDMAHDDGLFVESIVATFTQTSPEARERVEAFLAKRAARLAVPEQSD